MCLSHTVCSSKWAERAPAMLFTSQTGSLSFSRAGLSVTPALGRSETLKELSQVEAFKEPTHKFREGGIRACSQTTEERRQVPAWRGVVSVLALPLTLSAHRGSACLYQPLCWSRGRAELRAPTLEGGCTATSQEKGNLTFLRYI